MGAGADVATGWTITFADQTYDADITDLDADGKEVPVIDVTHMGTTGSRVKTVGDLIDEGSVDISIHHHSQDWDTLESSFGVVQSITLTCPAPAGLSTGGTIVGSGAITKHNWSAPLEDKMVGNYTVTWMGAVTMTEAS